MGRIIKNKVIYSGGILNALGVFIDTDNVIKASTTIARDTTETYIATEDCIVIASYYGGNNDGNIKINNVAVSLLYVALPVNGVTLLTDSIPLKKGQTISITTRTYDGSYVVYGIQTGTEELPEYHVYSTSERIVGEWIDGKPVYEKTLAIPALSVGSNTIQHGISNFGKMIECKGTINYDGDDLILPYMQTQVSNGYVAYGIGISNFNSSRYFIILGTMFDVSKFSGGYVTVRYTKSA